ncbi:MAG TPA: 2-amino-4-hydroxy-6-hydroxymethyldihydropteridine diphosphokinase, partial [Gemmataceae bacterium]|nr:2-amino-4-hydroxy-6-hydroxymethyldihydropteridine diphosphokinase [Gemmataceae bacterium]
SHACSTAEYPMPATAYIALGSNLGDRRALLDQALHLLGEHTAVRVTAVSSYHETEPVGGPPGQGPYLNAAATLQTDLAPRDLLRLLLEVESRLGRVRAQRFGPRTIDLDLLLYGDVTSDDHELTLPHPRMHERLFVLRPLAEIAPHARHPRLGQTVREMLERQRPPGRELTGLRAVVTGSTGGIGRATALALAAGGADVVVHGRRSRESAEAVAALVRAAGVRGAVVLADLRDEAECRRLVDEAWRTWGGVEVWANIAGADTLTGEAARWPFERKLRELLAVDVTATMLLGREVGARMKLRGEGVILNVGWDQADTGMEGDSGQLFGATKAAVMAFSKSLAVSLAPEVRVNCVALGWIRTAWGEGASGAWQERVLRETPLRRWGTPEDVAAAARWLASPAAAYLTGQVVRVNGGAVR